MSPVDSPSPAFPSPASSLAETLLPTPDQPYSSRRSSLASPRFDTLSPVDDETTQPHEPEITPKRRSSETVPTVSVLADGAGTTETSPPVGLDTFIAPPPPLDAPRHLGSLPGMSSNRNRRTDRRGTGGASSSIRAAPPPPILLRRSTDVNPTAEDIPLKTGSSVGSSSGARSPGGLNITGLPNISGSIEVEGRAEQDEVHDSLPDLLRTPARSFFGGADPNGAPASPAWQSMDAGSPGMPKHHGNGSPYRNSPGRLSPQIGMNGQPAAGQGRHRARGSLDVPFSPLSPLGPRTNERRFDPTPNHGIHARNLSLYFPQPGQAQERRPSLNGGLEDVKALPAGGIVASAGSKDKKPFGGTGAWSFGQGPAPNGGEGMLAPADAEGSKRSKRRGHHHKHSLSHNFFSFLDPTQTNPSLAASSASPNPKAADTPQKVPMPSHLLSAPTITPSSPTLSPLPPSKNTSRRQMLMSFGVLEFLIGAGLWVEGQMSGWRCLAGLGYLVVFDAMGVGVMLLGNGEGWSNVRRPYGTARFLSLMYFAQSLFLVFAAVYIAKESLEQVVLGAGAHDHAGGGAHSHGEIMSDGEKLPFPRFLLVSAILATAFSGGALGNHTKLVEAVGPLFLPHRLTNLRIAKRWSGLLSNPFSLTVAGCSALVFFGSLLLHESSFTSLDSALSLLLTVLTSALAYPPTLAFGHVLLQTAPPASAPQMGLLKRALKDIGSDHRVLGVGTVRCWSIGAAAPSPEPRRHITSAPNSVPSSPRTQFTFSPSASPTKGDFLSALSLGAKGKDAATATPLVVSVQVHVHPDTSDRDVLDLTKYAWMKVHGACGVSGMGRTGQGEVTVAVKRGWDGSAE